MPVEDGDDLPAGIAENRGKGQRNGIMERDAGAGIIVDKDSNMSNVNPEQGGLQVAAAEVLAAELDSAVPVAEAESQALAQRADQLVEQLLSASASGDPAPARGAVENMGRDVQARAARQSRLLEEPVHRLASRAEDGGPVANALVDLKVQVESLDPARVDLSPGWFSRLAGYLPFVGTPLKRYFSRYESASTVIAAIVESLEQGREQLRRDNITLQADQKDMRENGRQLSRAVALGEQIDARLSRALERDIDPQDPRHRFVQEELLFPLRQRIQDMQQQLAVNQQGVLTTEVIVRNNRELIRGVDRATQVTVNALRIAVTLAMALANQRIVLDKIDAVNKTTDTLIAGTAQRLRQQGAEIHTRAASTQLDMEVLRQAFVDINASLEDIARFRREALPGMADSIQKMAVLTRKGDDALSQLEQAEASRSALAIDLNP